MSIIEWALWGTVAVIAATAVAAAAMSVFEGRGRVRAAKALGVTCFSALLVTAVTMSMHEHSRRWDNEGRAGGGATPGGTCVWIRERQ